MSAPPPLNFISTLKDRRSAEHLLADAPFGAYVSWCLGEKEPSTFFVTYRTNIEPSPVHVQLTREPGAGTYRLTIGIDTEERFLCLEDFIASRGYLNPAAGGSHLRVPAPALAPDAGAVVGGLRRRGGGGGGGGAGAPVARLPPSLAAAPPPPGVIPPDDDAAEMYDRAGVAIDEERYFRGVRPVCGDVPLRLALERVGWVGAALGVLVAGARFLAHRDARTALVRASAAAEGAGGALAGALFAALREAGGDVGRCVAAVGAWQSGVSAAGFNAAAALAREEPWALRYAWLLLAVAGAAGGGSLVMFFVHTGSPPILLNSVDDRPRLERAPLCRPNQGRWARAFFSLLGAALLAAATFVSLLNGAAGAPTAASNVAALLSLRWPAMGGNAEAAAALTRGAAPAYTLWGGAMAHLGAPRACLAAVAAAVEPWVNGPPVLPLPLPLPAWGARGGNARAQFAWGWLQRAPPPGGVQLLLPTRAGISQGGLILASVYMFFVVVALCGVETWHKQIRPSLLRWNAQRGAKKPQAATE